MSKDSVLDLSTTAALNTDVGGVNINEGTFPDTVNDAQRMALKLTADAVMRHVLKTTGGSPYTAVKVDHGQFWRCSGAVTINLTAGATLVSGWHLWIKCYAGTTTIVPNGAETIDGNPSLVLTEGQSVLLIGTGGATFFTVAISDGGSFPKGYITSLTLSNNAVDPGNDIDIAAGAARDSTDVENMVLAAALTKRLDAAWAVGSGNGGLDTGAIANTTYHVWLIKRVDTNVVDVLFSTSATAPTMPADYTMKRRIGSIVRVAAALLRFTQDGDVFMHGDVQLDVNTTNPGTSAVDVTLQVPAGIVVEAIIDVNHTNGSNNHFVLWCALADVGWAAATPSATIFTLNVTSSAGVIRFGSRLHIRTNTSRSSPPSDPPCSRSPASGTDGLPDRASRRGRHSRHAVRLVLDALAPFVLDHVALGVDGLAASSSRAGSPCDRIRGTARARASSPAR